MRDRPVLDRPVAVLADQAAGVVSGIGRQVEGDARQVDHDPVGVGEHIDRVAHGLAQIGHEAGANVVAADAGACRHRLVGRRGRRKPVAAEQEQQRQGQPQQKSGRSQARGRNGL